MLLQGPPALPRDADGREYGTAAQIAARLTTTARPITAATIRKWAWRSRQEGDRLHGMLPSRHTIGPRRGVTGYHLIDAARVAAATRPDPVR